MFNQHLRNERECNQAREMAGAEGLGQWVNTVGSAILSPSAPDRGWARGHWGPAWGPPRGSRNVGSRTCWNGGASLVPAWPPLLPDTRISSCTCSSQLCV